MKAHRTPLRDRLDAVVGLYLVFRAWGHGRVVSLAGAVKIERLAELRARDARRAPQEVG